MERIPIRFFPELVPEVFRPLAENCPVYDSSCSPGARVYFLDRDGGLFLKSAPRGTLAAEAEMTRYFHSKGLSAQVLGYESLEQDWLLTTKVPGEDCLNRAYLEDPKRLCEATAAALRHLHSLPTGDCPVRNRNESYIATTYQNRAAGKFDPQLFPASWGSDDPEEAWAEVIRGQKLLKADTLIHGDYCLPNVMLDNWRFSGFLDVGQGGIGDRHIDLFWGIWTLFFNLKTEAYTARFLDAYGREALEPEMLRIIAAFERFC